MSSDTPTPYDPLVDAAMARLAADPADAAPLPDPAPIYWRARVLGRLESRQRAAEQAARPVELAQATAALLIAATAAVALVWAFPDLLGWTLRSLAGGEISRSLAAAGGSGQLLLWAMLALLLGGGVMGLQVMSERG